MQGKEVAENGHTGSPRPPMVPGGVPPNPYMSPMGMPMRPGFTRPPGNFNLPPPAFLAKFGPPPGDSGSPRLPQMMPRLSNPNSPASSPGSIRPPGALPIRPPGAMPGGLPPSLGAPHSYGSPGALPVGAPPRVEASTVSAPAAPSSVAAEDKEKSGQKNSVWTEHRAGDRVYYYNTATKQSVWEKPDELKTPSELLLSKCPWKEYKSDTGKIYFHNVQTKESRWTIPQELENLKEKIAKEESNSESEESKKVSAIEQAMAATLAAIDTSPAKETKVVEKPAPVIERKIPVFKDKKEAIDSFKDFLRQKGVPSDATWEKAMRIVQNDPMFQAYNKLSEKKQAFHSYKVHRAKEEKEEQRLKAKKAKEDLEDFLINNKRMTSTTKYYACHDLFHHYDLWQNVGESERKEIYEDVIFALQKKEKEENKAMRKKNMKALSEILDNMGNISFKTTWSEAQQMLIDNPVFSEDTELLSMDKEDALIVFAEHIKQLEEEEEEERDKKKKRIKRIHRKTRDNYVALLDSLHDEGKLTSMSLWVELHPLISADVRYSLLLGQPGSNPLDLFKFYVADLKSRFHDEKKIIKEILKEKDFDVQVATSFMDFATVVCDDARSATLDAGNVKLTYNALMEKAEAREKERLKEETRKTRRLESAFRSLLRGEEITGETKWEDIREKLQEDQAFVALNVEAERIRLFNEFQGQLEESCGHHHVRPKKKSKKRRRSVSSGSGSEDERRRKRKRGKRKRGRRSGSSSEEDEKRKRKKKRDEEDDGEEEEGELSESELEKKRALLMKELENAS